MQAEKRKLKRDKRVLSVRNLLVGEQSEDSFE